ncbi:uncharacterized protein LOC128960684 [Oppia nitens]|uniref:uncharacterized protein LOC128960684 n=1 Tax=Oppia nitens TaxID=1686743 RepID=UPI0023DAB2C3|nr:uncharacterized protein LOC128960684 [Oppia nitens]
MSDLWTQYWGESLPTTPEDTNILTVERSQLTRVTPIDLQNTSDKLDLNLTDEKRNFWSQQLIDNSLVSDVPIGCPVMLQTIKLLRLLRQLNNGSNNDITRQSIPQLITSNTQQNNGLNIFKIKNKVINEKAIKELMRRSVVIISNFYGIDYMSQSVMDLLVDLMSEYLHRLCQRIRITTDSSELKSSNDFIDVIDRVFHDMNVSNFEALRQHQSDINLYNQNLLKEVERRISINESIINSNKMSNELQTIVDNESIVDNNSPSLSSSIQSLTKDTEPTLSLKSLLSSYKSDDVHENEQLFGLTSPLK